MVQQVRPAAYLRISLGQTQAMASTPIEVHFRLDLVADKRLIKQHRVIYRDGGVVGCGKQECGRRLRCQLLVRGTECLGSRGG